MRSQPCFLLYGIVVPSLVITTSVQSFVVQRQSAKSAPISWTASCGPCAAVPQRRQPRRHLEKRKRRRGMEDSSSVDDFPWDSAESRPMVPSMKKELGEDYWVDERELAQYQAKLAEQKKRDPGQIPEEKLWNEVLSPYKNNWIGIISVTMMALAFIFKVGTKLTDD